MKKASILLFLTCSVLPLCGRDIQINVTDKDLQSPLEGVTLSIPGGISAKTDAGGLGVLTVPDPPVRLRLVLTLIGYEPRKLWIEPAQTKVDVALSLAGVTEGTELVVEKAKPQKTDEQAGVSQVATRDEIQNTANMGIVEDVMNTIKSLPGVGFTGNFSALPSIQGGDPNETKTVLDGADLIYPYQWGGAYSIFDPNMVDSAKLSDGLISARYGEVLSGLIEVNSRTPVSDTAQFDVDESTSGMDASTLIPFGPAAGLLVDAKATWYGLLFPLVGLGSTFNTAPYIDNGYARFFWKPNTNTEWDLNGFVGSDGIGVKSDASGSGLTTDSHFDYHNLFVFGSSKLSTLIDPDNLLTFNLAYNRLDQGISGTSTTNGTVTTTGSVVDNFQNTLQADTLISTYQAKASLDHQVAPGQVLSFGLDGNLTDTDASQTSNTWSDQPSNGSFQLQQQQLSFDVSGNYELASGAYGLWESGTPENLWSGELGLRVDHVLLFNNDMQLNTYPVANPRGRLVYTPIHNAGWFNRVSLTGGSGLYSQMTLDTQLFSAASNHLQNFDIGPDRAWFNSLGVEVLGDDGWKISVEGYEKLYFNRLYVVQVDTVNPVGFIVRNDGTGQSFGVDVMVQKRLSRYWDGWLTYSFNDTRLHNPYGPTYSSQTTVNGDPLGIDFYPSYQRFHTVHLVSDWKPVEGFAVLVDASAATGAPRTDLGSVQSYVSTLPNGQSVTRYAQTSSYSDTLRNGLSCPVDLKLSWSGYYAGTTVRWETYIAVQDVFATLYSAQTNSSLDPWTGQTTSTGADFSLGIPVPSVGFKVSF